MATAAYWKWKSEGEPWTLAKPIEELEAWAEAERVPVLGTIGNEEHLQDEPPEDHTPFSATAWPVPLDGYKVTAIDLENVTRNGVNLGWAMEKQGLAGQLPYLKYMNHAGRHIDFRTGAVTRSSDLHVHASIRTDWQNRSVGFFDPFGTTQGVFAMGMILIAQDGPGGQFWRCDGMERQKIPAAYVPHLKYLGSIGAISVWQGGPDNKTGIWPNVSDILGIEKPGTTLDVDEELLAQELAKLIPIPPTAEEVADAVVAEIAS